MNLTGILAACASASAAFAITVDGGDTARRFTERAALAPVVASTASTSTSSPSWPGNAARLAAAAEDDGAVIHAAPPRTLPSEATARVVDRARADVTNHIRYDASYQMLSVYPNGDIPQDRGACTDTVIRAFRAIGVDLQVLVHEDIAGDPETYGAKPDANVDHRRVGTLYQYLGRRALSLSTEVRRDRASFEPGDIVFFAWKRCHPRYPCTPDHVALVSDRIGRRGLPLVLQNGGPTATESDGLDHGTLVGHFRLHHAFHAARTPSAR